MATFCSAGCDRTRKKYNCTFYGPCLWLYDHTIVSKAELCVQHCDSDTLVRLNHFIWGLNVIFCMVRRAETGALCSAAAPDSLRKHMLCSRLMFFFLFSLPSRLPK